LRAWAIALIDDTHKRNPERAGVDLNELRTAWRDRSPGVFDALISDLCSADFFRKGSAIARASHRPTLAVELSLTGARIRETLSTKPFDPPARKEIEVDRDAQQVLRFLIVTGEAIEVGSDVVLLRENFERMKSGIVEYISKHGPATVGTLRQKLQTSRRIMVPLLERLDRDGVTRRVEDKRMLGKIT
jgi:selenocysteine-specific elongation factor